jgi:hypothetical protein
MTDRTTPPFEASDDLMEIIFTALDHGVASVAAGGPLIPFLLFHQADSGRNIQRFVADDLQFAIDQGRQAARHLNPVRYALAYDGYVRSDGDRQDAILVEAAEGPGALLLFAQRYHSSAHGREATPIGNAMYLGTQPR